MAWIRTRDLPDTYHVCKRLGSQLSSEFKRWDKATPDMFLRIGTITLFRQEDFEEFLRERSRR